MTSVLFLVSANRGAAVSGLRVRAVTGRDRSFVGSPWQADKKQRSTSTRRAIINLPLRDCIPLRLSHVLVRVYLHTQQYYAHTRSH